MQEATMLERTSRFVLEVMPYLLAAVIAMLLVPSVLVSQGHGAKAVTVRYVHDAAFTADRMPSKGAAETAEHTVNYR
jgi:hypothetical protein